MMMTKDWISLIVPILANGVIIFIFQKIVSRKIDNINKREDLRNDVVKRFWNKLQDINDFFIEMNIEARRQPDSINDNLLRLEVLFLDLIKYYDTNQFDLKIFKESFEDLQTKWNDFSNTWRSYSNIQLTKQMQMELGKKTQAVKDANQKLIDVVRKKY